MNCLTCGVEIAPPRTKYCSNSCKCKDHQRKRSNDDTLAYYSRTPRNFFQSLLQKKAKDRQLLDIDFLVDLWEKQNGLCAITKTPMTHLRGHGRVQTNVSIDRIDSTIGYERQNVQLVCHIVNLMKQDLKLEELLVWSGKIHYGLSR